MRSSRSRAQRMSLASVGNITFFGCTVVSTINRRVSAGFIAPLLTATARLSRRSAPRSRVGQRVIDERSKGRAWRKNSSPRRCWK